MLTFVENFLGDEGDVEPWGLNVWEIVTRIFFMGRLSVVMPFLVEVLLFLMGPMFVAPSGGRPTILKARVVIDFVIAPPQTGCTAATFLGLWYVQGRDGGRDPMARARARRILSTWHPRLMVDLLRSPHRWPNTEIATTLLLNNRGMPPSLRTPIPPRSWHPLMRRLRARLDYDWNRRGPPHASGDDDDNTGRAMAVMNALHASIMLGRLDRAFFFGRKKSYLAVIRYDRCFRRTDGKQNRSTGITVSIDRRRRHGSPWMPHSSTGDRGTAATHVR